jgi:hypothetical protein
MLDKLQPQYRHLAILIIGGALGTLAEQIPALHLPSGLAQLAGAVVSWGLLWTTKLTEQYGIKK